MPKGIKSAPPAAPAVAPAVEVAPSPAVAASPEVTPKITRPPRPDAPRVVQQAPAASPATPDDLDAALEALGPDATQEQLAALFGGKPVEPAVADNDDADDDAPGPVAADPNRPEWLNPKYKTVEDQAKAYSDLEKLLGKKAGDLTTKGAEKVDPAASQGGEAWTALNEATIQEIGSEYLAKGDLSPETYAKIEEKFKIPPATAKVIVETRVQQVQAQNAQLVVDAGFATLDEFRAAQQWAVKALPAGDMQTLDAMLGDASAIRRGAAVRMLRDLHGKANPKAKAPRVAGVTVGTGTVEPIRSKAEFSAATANPLFGEDSAAGHAYRQQVVARASAGGYSPG